MLSIWNSYVIVLVAIRTAALFANGHNSDFCDKVSDDTWIIMTNVSGR